MPAESLTAARLPSAAGWLDRWPVALRVALVAIALIALRRQLTAIDGAALLHALGTFGWPAIALAFACTSASFLTLGAMEIVALRAADNSARVPHATALVTAFVAHAISQSAGVALLTGAGVRLRAYAGERLQPATVPRVAAFVTGAVTTGLLSVASVAWLATPWTSRAEGWPFPSWIAAVVLASILLSGAAWSAIARRFDSARPAFRPPAFAAAAALVALSALDWLLTASVLFVLLPPGLAISYPAFIAGYLVAQAAGMLSHVPAGAGVFEAAILALLASHATLEARSGLAASIVAFRVVYYLVPLGIASAIGAVVESRRSLAPPQSGTAVQPRPDREAPRRAIEQAPEWLIDNAAAYDRMLRAIASARRSVWMTQLAFDADCLAYANDDAATGAGTAAPPGATVIAESLIAAVARAQVDVRILLNATLLLDTARPLRRFFSARLAALPAVRGGIRVRGVSCFPQLLHAKMVIVDGKEAFLLGSPFANGYWDDRRHHPVDARRPARELGGRPLHDLSVRIEGPCVAHCQQLFTEWWTHAEDDPTLDAAPFTEPPANGLRVVCTTPRRVLPRRPEGATDILDAVIEGITGARSLIYIEHQYLSARPIVAALAGALDREPGLELIVVLNQNPDVTAYRGWQNARLAESGLLNHPRAGFFSLWSVAGAAAGGSRLLLNQVFVHSKVLAVDDRWATTGSANLDGVSLYSYGDDFTGRLARRVFRDVRNFDLNIVVQDEPGRADRAVATLRSALWSEHLSMPADDLRQRPPGGWLTLWRARAAANVAALASADGAGVRGFVLPYSGQPTPAAQLADLGVPVDRARLDVRFDPGWLEVHFSPNWVRNMFA